jgi:hypothetical protein
VLTLEQLAHGGRDETPRPDPAQIPFVSLGDNGASRAHPAGGRRRLPQAPAEPRKGTVGKPCSPRQSPPIPAQTGTTKTGLSRRRSRVRVPSLLSLEVPANRHLMLSIQAPDDASWPKPVAQTFREKCLQIRDFVRELVARSHEPRPLMRLCRSSAAGSFRSRPCAGPLYLVYILSMFIVEISS